MSEQDTAMEAALDAYIDSTLSAGFNEWRADAQSIIRAERERLVGANWKAGYHARDDEVRRLTAEVERLNLEMARLRPTTSDDWQKLAQAYVDARQGATE